jgi:hypothetical protein
MGSEWLSNVRIEKSVGDSGWYVCYHDGKNRLRLTIRGTWSVDDMDIYWKSQAKAIHALNVAPCPFDDPHKRIADLEEAVRVLAVELARVPELVSEAAMNNPIAAAAVRKASDAGE